MPSAFSALVRGELPPLGGIGIGVAAALIVVLRIMLPQHERARVRMPLVLLLLHEKKKSVLLGKIRAFFEPA